MFFFPPLDISVTWSGSFLILLQCRKHHLSELELCVGISTPSFIPIVTVLPRSWEAPLCLPPSECRVMRAVLWHTPMYEMTPSFRKPENPAQGHTVKASSVLSIGRSHAWPSLFTVVAAVYALGHNSPQCTTKTWAESELLCLIKVDISEPNT